MVDVDTDRLLEGVRNSIEEIEIDHERKHIAVVVAEEFSNLPEEKRKRLCLVSNMRLMGTNIPKSDGSTRI